MLQPFEPGDRVKYTVTAHGEMTATVRRHDREGKVVVWPDRWGEPGPADCGEALWPSMLTRIDG